MLFDQILHHSLERPDQTAVQDGVTRLSYAQLARASDGIAARLRAAAVAPGALVAIYQARGALMVASIVGIWRSGGAYTVVEADGVAQEHYHRLGVIGADVVLTTAEHAAALSERGLRVCVIDGEGLDHVDAGLSTQATQATHTAPAGDAASGLAYVLFTSGSTGVPKGVMVTHGNIAHYVNALIERLQVPPGLTYAHVSTMSADLGNTSLFLSLWTGGTLHVIDEHGRKDPSALLDYLAAQRIDVLKITPSHWEAIFALSSAGEARELALRYLILGGEALSAKLARAVLDSGIADTLVNHYGPTETTVGITVFPMRSRERAAIPATDTVPIGLPLGATRLVVHTADGAYARHAAQGELYVGGPGVSAGYRNNPEANARAFVSGIDGAERFYRTGDIVRIDEDGVVHFLGRVDRQVKVNGYRIELEQIERALKSLDGCEGAAAFLVTVRNRPAIFAAVLARGERSADELKAELAAILPAYMLPRALQLWPEFPLTPNGKTDLARLKAQVEEAAQRAQVAQHASATQPADPDAAREPGAQDTPDPTPALTAAARIRDAVRDAWRHCIGHAHFADSDDFFALGADSLDAIGVIARLQAAGYRVSAHSFLKQPTVAALVGSIVTASADAPDTRRSGRTPDSTVRIEHFSAAQRAFFAQSQNRVDHHNQALVFDIATPVSVEILARALERVRDWHPMLSTRYLRNGDGWIASRQPVAQRAPVLDSSALPATRNADTIAVLIRRTSQALQASLNLAQGRVFAAHLFTRDSGGAHLVLCAHHVVVDAVSWRIIVEDIVRLYSALLRTGTEPAAPHSDSFWDWAEHVGAAPVLQADAQRWRALPAAVVQRRMGVRFKGNLERHAKTVWLSLTPGRTSALLRDVPEKFGAPFHHVLLAAFLHAFDEHTRGAGQDHLVEIESHGRMTFDDTIDVSRTVGWFTSAWPVVVSTVAGDLAASVGGIDRTLANVPHLGIAYGVHREALESAWGGMPAPRFCYNYLGQFEFGDDDALTLQPSTLSPGFARGYDNDRVHEFRLTARIVDGRLICDLGYSGEQYESSAIRAVLERTAALLGGAANPPAADGGAVEPHGHAPQAGSGFHTFVEPGSSAGLLTYRPAGLQRGERDEPGGAAAHDPLAQRPDRRARGYRHVLMSGATGFLGAYVLRELLAGSAACVHCVVRAPDDAQAAARLAAAFDWYFPERPLATFGTRVRVYAGDVTEERLGIAGEIYDLLDLTIDAIYHFAADTRLFAADEVLERQNIVGTRRLIELAGSRRPKDLHHMSTLAVCGVNRADAPLSFSEATLDIGQDFQNAYERTKFRAEVLVREFVSRGGRAFIYRSGNVSADSRTARFQRKAGDNRFVQLLRAAVKVASLPRQVGEPVALSPVDVVARGIVALSLDGACGSGTYHVDTPWEVPMTEVFDTLRSLGVHFETTLHASFAELFSGDAAAHDRDVALGYFWATRPARRITFDHARTLRILAGNACTFEPPRPEWLRAFLAQLVDAGVLPSHSALSL